MKQLLPRTRVAIAIGLAAATLALPVHSAPRAVEVDRIVAVVNNEVITGLELRARIEQTRRQLARQGVELPPEDVLQRQLLERLIVERAQLQLARESSLRVDDATLDRAIERIASNNKLSIDQLRATLEKDGVTWSRFRDEIRSEILLTRLREREVDSRIVVTDAEIDNFIANNPDAFSGQEFFPDELAGENRPALYLPNERGFEREIRKRLEFWMSRREQRRAEEGGD